MKPSSLLGLGLAALLTLALSVAAAEKDAVLTSDAWKNIPRQPVKPGEVDALIAKEQQKLKLKPAATTSDEQFLRRASLDLIGQLPTPEEAEQFAASKDSDKRAKLIDKLLASEKFARQWARYWRNVISSRLTDQRGQQLAAPFEDWLTEQFKADKGWHEITRAMLTAEGAYRFDDTEKTSKGPMYFLLSRQGTDAIHDRAAETSRIFLGINVQCAQCHNHPFDQWKQNQFHELAAYFARVRERQIREENRQVGVELASLPRGEHRMSDNNSPRAGTTVYPRFLTGKAESRNLDDKGRRKALADAVTDQDNYWFAAAFVNRMWGELMGQSFYQPVDDMGPIKNAVMPDVLSRLAAAFQASDFDPKTVFRTIMNTRTYQQQIRLGDSSDQHLHFAGAYAARLDADSLWQSLVGVLGPLSGGQGGFAGKPGKPGPFGQRFGLEGLFKSEFAFDPSIKADEVENSVSQALFMMNNPAIHAKIEARGTNVLVKILKDNPQDDDAIRALYVRVLARKPTDRELQKSRAYVKKVNNRNEAFEDLLWALLNSTEFQTQR